MTKHAILPLVLILAGGALASDDWPTYRHDNHRSGVTPAAIETPLALAWKRVSRVPPRTAWSGPAPWDAYAGNRGLQPQRDFDPAFYTTAAAGLLYFGSSVDDAVHCLDAATGQRKWVFFTGAAVRLPPTIYRGKAYFGSDDGYLRCVDAVDGSLLWKLRGGPSDTLLPCDGKLISPWPCRTGVLVAGDVAYAAFSLVPWKDSFLYAIHPADGRVVYRKSSAGNTFQGALAAGNGQLVVSQGKAPPIALALQSGDRAAVYAHCSGTSCTLLGERLMAAQPASQKNADNVIQVVDRAGGGTLAAFAGADRLLYDGGRAYLHRHGRLAALDLDRLLELSARREALRRQIAVLRRKSSEDTETEKIKGIERDLAETETEMAKTTRWEVPCDRPFTLIKAGRLLLVGTDGQVIAVDTDAAATVWTAEVEGRVRGLTVAGGRLFASTDRGHIYAWAPRQ